MAKFDSSSVESLDFDFTEWGGGAGKINEPDTARINRFFRGMRALMAEVKALQDVTSNIEELSDDEALESVGKMSEATEGAEKYQNATLDLLAEFCGATKQEDGMGGEEWVGGSPTRQDLARLPFRVLQAFTAWLMEQIKPKKTTPGSKR